MVIYFLNIPEDVFLRAVQGQLLLDFNPHYSYFSLQSSEMISSNYYSRLKISNQYPLEWPAYHFFSSAFLSIIRFASYKPETLLSYFYSQLVLLIIVITSISEIFFLKIKLNLKHYVTFIIWLLCGLSIFEGAIGWLIYSNSLISLWATVFFVWACIEKNLNKMILAILILLISSSRFIPISFFLLFSVWYLYRLKAGLFLSKKLMIIFIIFSLIYIISSFAFPVASFIKFFNIEFLSPVWHHLLFLYRNYGELQLYIGKSNSLPIYEIAGSYFNFFEKINNNKNLAVIYSYSCMLIITLISIFISLKLILKNRIISFTIILTNLLFLYSIFVDYKNEYNLFFFILALIYPYSILITFLLLKLNVDFKSNSIKIFNLYWVIGCVYMLTGANQIKGPISYSLFDITIWTLMGIYLHKNPKKYIIFIVPFLLFLFPLHFSDLFRMQGSNFTKIYNINDPSLRISDLTARELDANTAYFGLAINSSDLTKSFITNDFIPVRP